MNLVVQTFQYGMNVLALDHNFSEFAILLGNGKKDFKIKVSLLIYCFSKIHIFIRILKEELFISIHTKKSQTPKM